VQTPANGYLTGQADMITANGQFLNSVQQARITQSQADVAQLGVRTAIIQQKQYEDSLIPTMAEKRQQEAYQALQTARNNPPKGEIWAGQSLNALMTAFKDADAKGLRASDPVPLDPQVLAHINVTTGAVSTAGAGTLRNLTKFDWPFALKDPSFKKDRETIEALTRQAVEQLPSGPVPADLFRKLSDAVDAMNTSVKNNKAMSSTDYIESRTYLDQLSSSIQVLRDPNAANYFNGKYVAKGATVAELVQDMASQGLSFAPATAGDEPYYTSLYQSLLAYDYRLHLTAAR
jgi:hypothetical protein